MSLTPLPDVFDAVAPEALEAVLARLRAQPPDLSVAERWQAFSAEDWPPLFRLLDLAADLPRLAGNATLARLPAPQWPALRSVVADLVRLQELVDQPVVPPAAVTAPGHAASALSAAADELARRHCTTVDFLLDAGAHGELDAHVTRLWQEKKGFWGQLARADEPRLHALFDVALDSPAFRRLTGFDLARDAYSLTLSLQDLDPAGIGWHRDLYWPKEWVGEDVFAVLYALGSDSAEKGGAFVYYVPWENQILHLYRQHHQATILWNSRDSAGRLLHAVSRYAGADTSRHLVILQCLRRRSP